MAPESESSTRSAAAGSPAVAERFGLAQGALARGIAGPFGGLVAGQRLLILLPGEMALGQVVVGHRAAVGLLEHFDRPIVPSQQIQTDAQSDPAGRRMFFAALQFSDGVAQDGVLREIAGDALLHLPHFAWAKGVVLQDGLFQIEFDGLRHRKLLLITCRRRLPSPINLITEHRSATGVASYNYSLRKSQRRESNP